MQISDILQKVKTLHRKELESLKINSEELKEMSIRFRPDILVWELGLASNPKPQSLRVTAEDLLVGGCEAVSILSASVTIRGNVVTEILPSLALDREVFSEPTQEESVGLAVGIIPLVKPWLDKVAEALRQVGFTVEEDAIKGPPPGMVESLSKGRTTVH